MAVESPPWALQAGSYNAEQTRRAVFAWLARTGSNTPGIVSGGLLSSADCQLSAPVSGMSVNLSTGELIIGGSEGGAQGAGYGRVTSQTNLSIAAANASLPRIDTVCATMSDAAYTEPTGGSGSQWAPQVVTGTATAGATLANLNGVATLPLSSLLLGYVLVPANATNIITADIANIAGLAQGQQSQREWAYAQITSNVSVASSTESAGTTVITMPSFTPDGGPVMVEFFAPFVQVDTTALGDVLTVCLFEGVTEIAQICHSTTVNTSATVMPALNGRYRFTPTPAAHAYTITAFVTSVGGTPRIGAGTGGTGSNAPAFARFTKV